MIDGDSVAVIARVGGEVDAGANACGPRIVAGRASTVVVTIRETMARTRGRIAEMRVGGGRRVVMAWLRMRSEEAVAEVEREVVVLARRQRRVVPHNLRVVIGLGLTSFALRQPGTLLASA